MELIGRYSNRDETSQTPEDVQVAELMTFDTKRKAGPAEGESARTGAAARRGRYWYGAMGLVQRRSEARRSGPALK